MQNNPPATPAHVLVVDDDPTVAEVVAGYLDRAYHDVVRAADGPSALAHFARRLPGLGGAGPDAARHGRLRDLPPDA